MTLSNDAAPQAIAPLIRTHRYVYRHRLPVRIMHWFNVPCVIILLMSGLQIFNAHPALYWGHTSDFSHPVLAIGSEGALPTSGITTVLGHSFDTTGFLGFSPDASGRPVARAFPAWTTLPAGDMLSLGRPLHFFFAWLFVLNGALYLVYGFVRRHFQRDLAPSRAALAKTRRRDEAAGRYSLAQKLAYLMVIFGLMPLIVLTGMTMSPRLDAAFPILLELFGGRQSARTLHFIVAGGILCFILLHVLMVLASGPWNSLRAMITGHYAVDDEASRDAG